MSNGCDSLSALRGLNADKIPIGMEGVENLGEQNKVRAGVKDLEAPAQGWDLPSRLDAQSKAAGKKRPRQDIELDIPAFDSPDYLEWLHKNFPHSRVLLNKAMAIWTLVKKHDAIGDEKTLSDGKVRDIPYVSLSEEARVNDRFVFKDGCVQTLCRSLLGSINAAHVKSPQVFVWGSKGGGKSHLMNTFAFLKFCKHARDPTQPRVMWIPHLRYFAGNAANELFEALLLALLDAPEKIVSLFDVDRSFEALRNWMENEDLILIADNMNALENDSAGLHANIRQQAQNFVSYFGNYRRKVVYCASANENTVSLITGKQDGICKVVVFGDASGQEDLRPLFYKKFPDLQAPTENAEALAKVALLDPEACAAARLKTHVEAIVFAATKKVTEAAKLASKTAQAAADCKKRVEAAQHRYDNLHIAGAKSTQKNKKKARKELDNAKVAAEEKETAAKNAADAKTTAEAKIEKMMTLLKDVVTAATEVKKHAGAEDAKTLFETVKDRATAIASLEDTKIDAEIKAALESKAEEGPLEVEIFNPRAINWGRLLNAIGGIPMAIDSFLSAYTKTSMSFEDFFSQWSATEATSVKEHIIKYFNELPKRQKLDSEIQRGWSFLYHAVVQIPYKTDPELIDCAYFRPALQGDVMDWSRVSPVSEIVRLAALELWLAHEVVDDKSWQAPL